MGNGNGCVFFLGKKPDAALKKMIKRETRSKGKVHSIPPGPYQEKGRFAALVKSAPTIKVCADKSSVPTPEIRIALNNKLSFHLVNKGKVIHSSVITSSDLN